MTTRRDFIKYTAAGVVGFAAATAIEYPLLNSQIQGEASQIQTLNTQVSQLQTQLNTARQGQGFLALTPGQRTLVESIAETMVPTDSNGGGAKEAGVIYFIDRQLAGSYGKNGNMYLQGPWILPNQTGSIVVDGITYPGGTISPRIQAGSNYQYPFTLKEYWARGLAYLQEYANSAYSGNFETLTLTQRTQILQDLFDNKPTNFKGPYPEEFANELHDMVTAGYFTDPLYGGNQGMASWILTGSSGVNNGQSQGYTSKQLMVMSTPVRLTPMSLSQLQTQGGM